MQDVASAMRRAQAALLRRPGAGVHEDVAASARWQGGTRVLSSHTNGASIATDMPTELGGSGTHVTPGWLFRAGVAACAATSIAMHAAAEDIELTALEVVAVSNSDLRGLLGMREADGRAVPAGPLDVQLRVRIGAAGVAPDRLRALVQSACARSPMACAVRSVVPLALHVDVD